MPEKMAIQLTPRQREILILRDQGVPLKMIADQLGISTNMVKHHLQRIYKKTGTHSSAEACHQLLRGG